jgi:hypothetical protein
MHRQRDVQTVQTHVAVMPVVDMPADKEGAVFHCRFAQKHARTGDIAIAGFEVNALQLPGHERLPFNASFRVNFITHLQIECPWPKSDQAVILVMLCQ